MAETILPIVPKNIKNFSFGPLKWYINLHIDTDLSFGFTFSSSDISSTCISFKGNVLETIFSIASELLIFSFF